MLREGTPKSTLMLLLLRMFIIVYLYLRNTPHDLLEKKTSLFLGKIVCCTSDSLSRSNNQSIWEWIHDLGFKAPVETRFGIFFGGQNQTWQWKSLYQWRNSWCFSCFTILKGILPVHQKNHDEWFQPILQKNESHWCSSWQVSTTTSQVLSENRSQKKSHDYIRFPKRKDSHKSEGSPWTSLFPLVLSAHLRVSEVESHHVQSVNHDFYHLFNGNFRILKCSYVSTI